MSDSRDGTTTSGRTTRVLSIDALRGFDMFFITGGSALVSGICSALGCGDGWIASQMRHAQWIGFTHHDTIFPLFLFIAGVSWPFSLASQIAKGWTTKRIHAKIAVRVAVLFLIGLSFGGILKFKPGFRLMSVLGFIGLSWGVAASVYLHVKRPSFRWLVAALLFTGQFALLHFLVAPDAANGVLPYTRSGNFPMWIDRALWPSHMLSSGFEPESVFLLQGGVLIALAGMVGGDVLRRAADSPHRKAMTLLAASLVFAAGSALLVRVFNVPIVKNLWTASFVFASLAYAFAMLAAFFWIVDIRGWRKWTVVFRPVGRNSILAYMLMMTGTAAAMHRYLFSGLCDKVGSWGAAVAGFTLYLTIWGVLWYLEKKHVLLKI